MWTETMVEETEQCYTHLKTEECSLFLVPSYLRSYFTMKTWKMEFFFLWGASENCSRLLEMFDFNTIVHKFVQLFAYKMTCSILEGF